MIGKIVKSNSHTDYICQVYGPGEIDNPPAPADYGFGTFVFIPLPEAAGIVGVIYDTKLFNPDFGNLGPRLSPEPDLEIFSPDYLAEKMTLVGIKTVGKLNRDGTAEQGIPPLSVPSDSEVRKMDPEEVKSFHLTSQEILQIEYAPFLLDQANPLARHLLLHIIDHLIPIFPEHEKKLSVLYQEWSWQARIKPVGGLA